MCLNHIPLLSCHLSFRFHFHDFGVHCVPLLLITMIDALSMRLEKVIVGEMIEKHVSSNSTNVWFMSFLSQKMVNEDQRT